MYKTRMGRNFKVMVEFLQFWLAKKKVVLQIRKEGNFSSSTRFYVPLKTHRFASV